MAKKTRIVGGVARKSTGHSPSAAKKYASASKAVHRVKSATQTTQRKSA